MKRLLLVAALLLVGCKNTTDPYLVEQVCVPGSEFTVYNTVLMPVSCGKGCTSFIPIITPVTQCVRKSVMIANPDYRPKENHHD